MTEPRHCPTDPAVDDHLPPFLRAECVAYPADHDWPDAPRFVEADEYERTFRRWLAAEDRADRNAVWGMVGWVIAGFLVIDLLMRSVGSPW